MAKKKSGKKPRKKGVVIESHEFIPELSSRQRSFEKSRAILVVVILIPLLLIGALAIFIVQQNEIHDMRDKISDLNQEVLDLKVQNAFYKQAYEITLEDIISLSKLYGGDDKYERFADDLKDQELEILVDGQNGTVRTYVIKNEGLWQEYAERGVIATSCLPEPFMIENGGEEIFVTIKADAGYEEGDLSIYVDGNLLEEMFVKGAEVTSFSLHVASGSHELTAVAPEGNMEISYVSFDNVHVPEDNIRIDEGAAWSVFDCENSVAFRSLDVPGAFRIPFLKS